MLLFKIEGSTEEGLCKFFLQSVY